MSHLGRLLGGLGAFASGVLGLYEFLRILQLRRFESYYREVRRIVQVARGLEDGPGLRGGLPRLGGRQALDGRATDLLDEREDGEGSGIERQRVILPGGGAPQA